MRCLIVADLHYSLPRYDWVTQVADRFDVVIVAGDHLDLSSLVDLRAQSVVVRKYIDLLRAKTRLVTCSGNHDLDSRDMFGEKVAGWVERPWPARRSIRRKVVHLRQHALHDLPVVGRSDHARPGRRAARRRCVEADRPLVLGPPCAARQFPDQLGRRQVFRRCATAGMDWRVLARPRPLGHVHRSPFTKGGSWVDRIGATWVFNAGHQSAPPAHIVVDTDEQEAIWISAAGVQSVRLDQPLTRPVPRCALPAWATLPDPAGGPNPA